MLAQHCIHHGRLRFTADGPARTCELNLLGGEALCSKKSLRLGVKRKELLDQRNNENSGTDFVFRVDGTPIQRAQDFKYLGRKDSEDDDDRSAIDWNIRT